MERPIYTVRSCVSEKLLRQGIRAGQRKKAVWVFAAVCAVIAGFGVYKIITADSLEDMYTYIVCVLVGCIGVYPAFTAGKRQERQVCAEKLDSNGELRQSVRFFSGRLTVSESGKKSFTVPYERITGLKATEGLFIIIAENRSAVFLRSEDVPEGLEDFLKGKIVSRN